MHHEPVPIAAAGPRRAPDAEDLRLLALLASGMPNQAVARALNTSVRTLQRRTRQVCDRIGVDTTVEAIAWAARRRLI